MKFINFFKVKLLFFLMLFSFTSCRASNYQRKINKNKNEIKEMANYVLEKYSNGTFNQYMIITIDTVKDEKLITFCKKYDIKNIYIHSEGGSEFKYLSYSVSFFKNYVPLLGKKTEVIVDYKSEEPRRNYPYPESFKRIDENIYFTRY